MDYKNNTHTNLSRALYLGVLLMAITVTTVFLFTNISGSASLLQDQGGEVYSYEEMLKNSQYSESIAPEVPAYTNEKLYAAPLETATGTKIEGEYIRPSSLSGL